MLACALPGIASAQGFQIGNPPLAFGSLPTCDSSLAATTSAKQVVSDDDGTGANCNGNGTGFALCICDGSSWARVSGGSADLCSGVPNCFTLRDDGSGGGTAGDDDVRPEIFAQWNDEIVPALNAAPGVVTWAWAPHVGSDWQIPDTVHLCNTTTTGGSAPDCSTASDSDWKGQRLDVVGDTRLRIGITTNAAEEIPAALGGGGSFHDFGLWLGDGSAEGFAGGLTWNFAGLQIGVTRYLNNPVCTPRVAPLPVVFDGGRSDSTIRYLLEDGGNCQTLYPRVAPPVVAVGLGGVLRLDTIGDLASLYAKVGTVLSVYGPDRGLTVNGTITGYIDAGTYPDAGSEFDAGRWRGLDRRPSVTLGPELDLTAGAANRGTLAVKLWDEIRVAPGARLHGVGLKSSVADMGLSMTAPFKLGRLVFEGFAEDNDADTSGDGSADPAIRYDSMDAQRAAFPQDGPYVVVNGTVEQWGEVQTDKGILGVSGLSTGGPLDFAYIGPHALLRVCGRDDSTDVCLGSALANFPWPHYIGRATGGFQGHSYAQVRVADGRWLGASWDHSATAPDAERILASLASGTVTLDADQSSLSPVYLSDSAASFTVGAICGGDCAVEPFAYVTVTSGGNAGYLGRVVDVASGTRLDIDRRYWTATGSQTAGYKVQHARCYNPGTHAWDAACGPETYFRDLESVPEWAVHDQRITIASAPAAGVSCTPFWTRDGDPLGDEAKDWNATGETTFTPDEIGGTSLDEAGEEVYTGLTDGFDGAGGISGTIEHLQLRMMDGPNGRCFDPDFSGYTQCTIAAGGSQHLSAGGSCGTATAGHIDALTDAFDETDCDPGSYTGGGTTTVAVVYDGSSWSCAPANTGVPLIGAASDEAYAYPEHVVAFGEAEICGNGVDDDLDGLVDSADTSDCP